MPDVQTVRDILIAALENNFSGVTVYQQGTLSDTDDVPDEYFTYFVTETDDDRHYDNDAVRTVWSIELNFYSTDPARAFSVLRQAKPVLKAAGFTCPGSGYDVSVDDPEIHTGQGMLIYYAERI